MERSKIKITAIGLKGKDIATDNKGMNFNQCIFNFTREEFEQFPVFYQRLIASKFGIKPEKRERLKDVQSVIDKTRVQTKGYTGEEAPTYFYSDSRDLYAEIIEKVHINVK